MPTETDNNALAQELEACPDVMHERVQPIGQRETEYLLPASLKFKLLAALRTPAPASGEVGELVAKINWMLNARELIDRQIELQGPSALESASTELLRIHKRAFDLLPDMLERLAGPVQSSPDESLGWERGMRDAANICGSLAETTYDDADAFEAATGCEAAIQHDLKMHQRNRLAAIAAMQTTTSAERGEG